MLCPPAVATLNKSKSEVGNLCGSTVSPTRWDGAYRLTPAANENGQQLSKASWLSQCSRVHPGGSVTKHRPRKSTPQRKQAFGRRLGPKRRYARRKARLQVEWVTGSGTSLERPLPHIKTQLWGGRWRIIKDLRVVTVETCIPSSIGCKSNRYSLSPFHDILKDLHGTVFLNN